MSFLTIVALQLLNPIIHFKYRALDIQRSCFENNTFGTFGAILIKADTGLINNVDNFNNPFLSPGRTLQCPFMFIEELYECRAAKSNVCADPCVVSYNIRKAQTNAIISQLSNKTFVQDPPCRTRFEAVVPCGTTGPVIIQIYRGQRFIRSVVDNIAPYTLDLSELDDGYYTIRSIVNGKAQPSVTFRLNECDN
jgi:hypothetical protein